MSITTCSISGETLRHPVISSKSGHVFQKELIQKQIEATGECPVTGNKLTKADLIPIQTQKSAPPRSITTTAFPGMLNTLQSEWDTMVLQSYKLKQQLEKTRQQLSYTLYQYDAACRVICRLMNQRDQAKKELAKRDELLRDNQTNILQSRVEMPNEKEENVGNIEEDKKVDARQEDQAAKGGMNSELENQIIQMNQVLSSKRAKKEIPPSNNYPDGYYMKMEKIQEVKTVDQKDLQKGSINIWGNRYGLACVGKNMTLVDIKSKNVAQQKKFDASINEGIFINSQSENQLAALLACNDGTAKFISLKNSNQRSQLKVEHTITCHQSSINSVSRTSLPEYALLGSKDGHWSMHNATKGQIVFKTPAHQGINFIRSHPDGLVVLTADDNSVLKLWDIRSQDLIVAIDECKGMKFKGLDFSAKGINFAGSVVDSKDEGQLMIWDIRAFNKPGSTANAKKVNIGEQLRQHEGIAFDDSGKLLALSHSKGVDLIKTKGWKKLASVKEDISVLDSCFSPDGGVIGSLSKSGVVSFYKGQ